MKKTLRAKKNPKIVQITIPYYCTHISVTHVGLFRVLGRVRTEIDKGHHGGGELGTVVK